MSTTPPPPPFGQAPGPIPPAGAYDRRTLRAQRQAAAAQARWQRQQIRMQMRAARRTSIVGPVLLVAIGVILLLLQTGQLHWPDTLEWLGRWWPAVLILAGVVMAAEWAFDRQQITAAGTPLAPRRTLGGGTVALLIFLAFLGACVMVGEHGSAWARRNMGENFAGNGFKDWRQVFGARSEFSDTLSAPVAPDGTLVIDNPRGDVTVTGSSQDDQVHVDIQQHLYTWHHEEVDARRRAEVPRFSGDRTHLTLTAPVQDQDDADLSIEVPHGVAVIVRSGHGDVSLEELHGSSEIESHNGDVKLTGLTGPVHVRTQDDNGTVTAHSLSSGMSLDGHAGDISLSDIQGPVVLHGDFFGTSHLERIQGNVTFQSSFTNFACAGIPGELNIEGRSDLDAHQIDGPVTLTTSDRNLTLNAIRGGATVNNRNGSVTLSVVGAPQPVRIHNANGSVELAVPGTQGFAVQARTENGDIHDDFGLDADKNGEVSHVTGKIGGGGPLLDSADHPGRRNTEARQLGRARGMDRHTSETDRHAGGTEAPCQPETPGATCSTSASHPVIGL